MIEWLWSNIMCRLGYHQPAFSWFSSDGKDETEETICMCCHNYLRDGKVTTDPAVKQNVDEFMRAVARDVATL